MFSALDNLILLFDLWACSVLRWALIKPSFRINPSLDCINITFPKWVKWTELWADLPDIKSTPKPLWRSLEVIVKAQRAYAQSKNLLWCTWRFLPVLSLQMKIKPDNFLFNCSVVRSGRPLPKSRPLRCALKGFVALNRWFLRRSFISFDFGRCWWNFTLLVMGKIGFFKIGRWGVTFIFKCSVVRSEEFNERVCWWLKSYFSFIPRHCASFKFYLLRAP